MKCYTFAGGELSEGIAVRNGKKRHVVFVGERGVFNRYATVGFFLKNPPEVQNGLIRTAHLVIVIALDGRRFWTLAKPRNPNDPRIILRVNTRGLYRHGDVGFWKIKEGCEEIAVGYVSRGADPHNGMFNDGLLLVRPGGLLLVKIEGGPYYKVAHNGLGLVVEAK